MKVCLLALAFSFPSAAAFAQFTSPGTFTPFGLGVQDAGAAAGAAGAIAATNQAIQQCTLQLRGRKTETVCTTQTTESGKQ